MNSSEIKRLMISSLDKDQETGLLAEKLEQEGIAYDFSPGFTGRVLNRIFSADMKVAREIEFTGYLSLAFSRVALTGIAAIVLLLISIFLMEGSLSINSLLGLSDSQNEGMVVLLTGN